MTRLVVFLLCLFTIYSCEGNKEIDNPSVTRELKLEKNNITLMDIEMASIKILSGNGRYKTKMSSPDIVEVQIVGTLIEITALKTGSTTLTITDAENKTATIAIEVREPVISEGPPEMRRGFMTVNPLNLQNQDIQEMANWGANLMRIQIFPVKWAVEKRQDLWEMFPAYLDVLQAKIDYAATLGMKVVIDLHEPPILKDGKRTDVPYWGTDEFWNREDLLPNFIKMWEMIAERFKASKYNNVIYGYDLYNEAQHTKPSVIAIPYIWREQMAQPILDAIRKIDKDVWIVYEAGPWAGPEGFKTYQDKPLLPLDDERVIYSIHFYDPGGLTHIGIKQHQSPTEYTREQALNIINVTYPGWIKDLYESHKDRHWDKTVLRESLQPVIDFQKKYNVPIYVGEFSVIAWTPVQSSENWLRDAIDLFEELQWAWTYHAFREFQGWSLEHPEGSEIFWFNNQSAPQMAPGETRRAKVVKEALMKNRK